MPSYLPTLNWPIYSGWTQFTPTIPKLYWNVYSQEQRIKQLCMNYDKCEQYLDMVAQLTNDWVGEYTDETQAKLDELEELLWNGIEEGVDEWINNNLSYIFGKVVKQVFFGLTSNGHFCAYIPDSWSDITFDTGMVYGKFDYGRLLLRYNVDGSGVIDNTGRYDDSSTEGILESINGLNRRVTHNENTLYTELSRG